MEDIKSLPDHIMIKIFNNLSLKMIKECSLVCKRWNEIISNTTEIMERFVFSMALIGYEGEESAMKVNRKHHMVIAKELPQDVQEIICRHNLKSLGTHGIKLKVSELVEVMKHLPALKHLAFYADEITDDYTTANSEKIHHNLEELRCGIKVMHLFDCSSLEILELIPQKSDNYNRRVLMDLLMKQKDLQELDISDDQADDFFSSNEFLQLEFALETFRICRKKFQYYENLIKFLSFQKASLNCLKLDMSTDPLFGIDEVQSYAIMNLPYLESLRFGYKEARSTVDKKLRFDDLNPEKHIASNIESLELYSAYDLDGIKKVFQMLPNLKRFTIEAIHAEDVQLLQHISATNPKLEAVNYFPLPKKNNDKIYFPNLKELNINGAWKEKPLCKAIKRHAEILEKIIIADAEFLTEPIAIEIMKCKNLKRLELHTFAKRLRYLNWFCDISKKDSFTLRIVTIMESFETSKDTYKFPDDKAIWKAKMKSFYGLDI